MPALPKTKKCSKCGEIKGVEKFSKNKNTKDGYTYFCKMCVRRYQERYWAEHPGKQKEAQDKWYSRHREQQKIKKRETYKRSPEYWSLWLKNGGKDKVMLRKYNITADDRKKIFKSQLERCAICHTKDPAGGKGNGWVIDHNHITGRVRGILCNRCNVGIGFLKDDLSILRSAADYLEKWESQLPIDNVAT